MNLEINAWARSNKWPEFVHPDGDTFLFVEPGDSTCLLEFNLRNIDSSMTVDDVVIKCVLPPSVSGNKDRLGRFEQIDDTLLVRKWNYTLLPNQAVYDSFHIVIADTSTLNLDDIVLDYNIYATHGRQHNAEILSNIASGSLVLLSDLEIMQTFDTEPVTSGDTLNLALGGTYSYSIIVHNKSAVRARDVHISSRVPNQIRLADPSENDCIISGDSLMWNIGSLDGRSSKSCTLTFTLDHSSSMLDESFEYRLNLTALNDLGSWTNLSSSSIDTLSIKVTESVDADYDKISSIKTMQKVRTDAFKVIASDSALQDTVWFVSPGESFLCRFFVKNDTTITPEHIVVYDELPPFTKILDEHIKTTFYVLGDTLVEWPISPPEPTMAHSDSFKITLSDSVFGDSIKIVNRVYSFVELGGQYFETEHSLQNIYLSTDLAVQHCASYGDGADCDSTVYLPPGDRVYLTTTIMNNGHLPAKDVELTHHLPESITVLNYGDIPPSIVNSDSLVWEFDELPAQSIQTIQIEAEILEHDSLEVASKVFLDAFNNDMLYADDDYAEVRLVVSSIIPDREHGLSLDRNVLRLDGTNPPLELYFAIQEPRSVKIDVVDISGYKVGTLVDETFEAGSHIVPWDGVLLNGQLLGSGVYILTFVADGDKLRTFEKILLQR